MPYQPGSRLSGETASKLGHLEVVKSPFVLGLLDKFTYSNATEGPDSRTPWKTFDPTGVEPLRLIIAVDGSLQTVSSDDYPTKQLSFVKTALVRLDRRRLEKVDKRMPHPVHMKALMKDSALQAATVFPLRNVRTDGMSNYHLVRHIIRDSLRYEKEGIAYETLKWLAYQKWTDKRMSSPSFSCPYCTKETGGLPHDADEAPCPECGQLIFISDMPGFHLDMDDDSAPESLATQYMLIHETLLLFSVVRYLWQQGDMLTLSNALLIKDGPLTLRGQYSKLVDCIRDLLTFAMLRGCPIHLIGQEKTGKFVDHLAEIVRFTKPHAIGELPSYAVLSHRYVRESVHRSPERPNPYGIRTNYGEKVLVKLDPYCHLVINIPTGEYLNDVDKPSESSDLIGADRILATLPSIVSYHHEGALIPINLANGVASLSSYPSAAVLKLFAGL
ncbi:hypothetical protein [Micromonospora aurantiaca (nom. illeg.)]|uniref:hypothetical protein n=1 Tax=Micromonospora aurantiaca (nom. illeg.) TaxID=47850 RepID=UPI00379FD36A